MLGSIIRFVLACSSLFTLSILLSANTAASTTTYGSGINYDPSLPSLRDEQGNRLTSANVGDSVMIYSRLTNPIYVEQPFVLIMDARDSAGVTQFLAVEEGVLEAEGEGIHREILFPWTPEDSGTYELRTFLISSFENVQILSRTVINEVQITE